MVGTRVGTQRWGQGGYKGMGAEGHGWGWHRDGHGGIGDREMGWGGGHRHMEGGGVGAGGQNGHRELPVARGERGQGHRVGTGRWDWHNDGHKGIRGLGAMGWAQQGALGAGEGTPQPPAPSPCPQRWPRALEGPAQPQPGSGALRPHPGAAGTRIQRRRHRRHLRVLHLPAQPFRWVSGSGGSGEGSQGPCGGARARPCRERPPRAPAPWGAPGAPGPARAPRLSPRPRAPRDADALQQHPARAGAGGDTRTAGTEGWRQGWWAPWGDKDPEVTGAPGQGGVLKQERRWGPWGDGDTGGEGPKGDGDFRT